MNHPPPTRPRRSEQGYILLGVLILLAIFIIAMAVAAPRIASAIQRDRDLETMQRGKQYIRAIKLYYGKFHAYPPNLDALVKTNEIRFLRRKYIDPVTGKDDWKPVMFGQNKTPMAMGFFGQPLGGIGGNVLAGTGPQGGNGLDNSGSGNSLFGNAGGSNSPTGGSIFNSPTDPSGGQNGQAGQTGQTGQAGQNGTQTGTGTSGTFGNGPTFGGGGIIGVSPASPKKSILVYKKKDHYNEWEFLYSPLSDMQTVGGGNAGTIGQPINGPGLNGPGVNGPGVNGPGLNGGGSMPNQPTPTPTPTPTPQPQQ